MGPIDCIWLCHENNKQAYIMMMGCDIRPHTYNVALG